MKTITLVLALIVTLCNGAFAQKSKYEITELATVSTKTELGKDRFETLKDIIVSRGWKVEGTDQTLSQRVNLHIFSVKSLSGLFDSRELILKMSEEGFRPAMASELLSLDFVENEAVANIPIVAFGSGFSTESGKLMGISVTCPQTEQKTEKMSVQFLINIDSTLDAGKFFVAMVKKTEE